MIGDGSPLIMFAAPTIFIDSMGNSFDVTPVYFSEPRPSLPANIDEDSFAELIEFFLPLDTQAFLILISERQNPHHFLLGFAFPSGLTWTRTRDERIRV